MKTKHFLLGLLLSIGSYTFAASTDPEILKIPKLKTLSENVDLHINKLNEAAKASRGAAAEAQTNLNAAYTEYAAELKKQKEITTNKTLMRAIDKELSLINEKMNAPKSTK